MYELNENQDEFHDLMVLSDNSFVSIHEDSPRQGILKWFDLYGRRKDQQRLQTEIAISGRELHGTPMEDLVLETGTRKDIINMGSF